MARRFYKRAAKVSIGNFFEAANLDDDGLRIAFKFTRNTMSEPDQGAIQIYNLSNRTRKTLENLWEELKEDRKRLLNDTLLPSLNRGTQLKALEDTYKVRCLAGYQKRPEQIFQGNIVDLKNKREGSVDWVTEIKVGDGLIPYREGYISEAFAPGVTIENFRKVVQIAMGFTESADAKAVISAVAPNAVVTQAANGIAAVGRAPDVLDEVAQMYGLQWWHRDGQIYYVPQGAVTRDFSIVIREGYDLISSPEIGSHGDIKGMCLLNARLYPGRGMFVVKKPVPFDIQNNKVNPITGLRGEHIGSANGLRCEAVTYSGDTHGQPWYTEFEARPATTAVVAPSMEFTEAELAALQLAEFG